MKADIYIPCFSPESLNDDMIRQVFWLVLFPADLPIRVSGQWLEVCRDKVGGTYSYGDSAGFTPDFPFNDVIRQP